MFVHRLFRRHQIEHVAQLVHHVGEQVVGRIVHVANEWTEDKDEKQSRMSVHTEMNIIRSIGGFDDRWWPTGAADLDRGAIYRAKRTRSFRLIELEISTEEQRKDREAKIEERVDADDCINRFDRWFDVRKKRASPRPTGTRKAFVSRSNNKTAIVQEEAVNRKWKVRIDLKIEGQTHTNFDQLVNQSLDPSESEGWGCWSWRVRDTDLEEIESESERQSGKRKSRTERSDEQTKGDARNQASKCKLACSTEINNES